MAANYTRDGVEQKGSTQGKATTGGGGGASRETGGGRSWEKKEAKGRDERGTDEENELRHQRGEHGERKEKEQRNKARKG